VSTLRRVASEADVSIATVSRVLNSSGVVSDDARHRVLEAASKLGYSGLRRSVGNYLALAYTGRSSVGSPYDVAILDGMFDSATENNFDISVIRLQLDRKSGESLSQLLQRKCVRGVVLRTNADTRLMCRELTQEGFPSIVVGDCFIDEPVNYLYCDSRPASCEAIEHLISLGHRRIAIAVSHIADNDHNDRLAGYEQALKNHQIELDPRLVYRVVAMRPNGAQVIRHLMSIPDRPTAIFIADPLVAVGAINQAHEMGLRIPQDVSIIGFDDTDSRNNVFPTMSAVCQDTRQLGYEAVRLLSRILANESPGLIQKTMPTWLELHQTTGCAPVDPLRVLPDGSRVPASTSFAVDHDRTPASV
jgi:LacI family repressor for deo operon, udp, cdd, tsx, nupC, and nupG